MTTIEQFFGSTSGTKLEPVATIITVLESITDAVYLLDTEWCFIYLNARAEELCQRTRAELLGTSLWAQFPESTGTIIEQEYRQALATGVATAFELFYPPFGKWFEVRAYPSPVGLVVYFQDITSERAVQAELQLQSQLLNQVPVAVIATDLAGTILHWNTHATTLYGWKPAEVIGKQIGPLTISDGDLHKREAIWSVLRAGKPWSGEITALRTDGTTFPAQVTDVPLYDETGQLTGVVGVSTGRRESRAG
jgi:PAS domain S-box-containing protein